jgi:hypothetical protein
MAVKPCVFVSYKTLVVLIIVGQVEALSVIEERIHKITSDILHCILFYLRGRPVHQLTYDLHLLTSNPIVIVTLTTLK